MSSIAESAILPDNILQMEKSIEFSPGTLRAPFFLRCAAFLVDYMLLLAVPVAWLIFSKFFGDGTVNLGIASIVWLFVLLVWVVNFLALPLFRGQTFGKSLAGITILRTDGRPVRLGRLLLRDTIGYFLSVLTLGIGFLMAVVTESGRSLHDYVAGTIVVYAKKQR